MIFNGTYLTKAMPISGMHFSKLKYSGTSYGLSEAGYDITIAQSIMFFPPTWRSKAYTISKTFEGTVKRKGRFVLASAIEKFHMPQNLVGVVHDKSTWARRGLSVFNTVIEPNFKGGLTLELVFHSEEKVVIERRQGIAQVLFSSLTEDAYYNGKYQNQPSTPVEAKFE